MFGCGCSSARECYVGHLFIFYLILPPGFFFGYGSALVVKAICSVNIQVARFALAHAVVNAHNKEHARPLRQRNAAGVLLDWPVTKDLQNTDTLCNFLQKNVILTLQKKGPESQIVS